MDSSEPWTTPHPTPPGLHSWVWGCVCRPTLSQQRFLLLLSYPEERVTVDLHGPLDQLVGTVQHALSRHHAGVVHQDAHVAAQVPAHRLGAAVHLLAVGHVHRVRMRLAAHVAHQLARLLVGRGVVVPEDHLGAVAGELLGEEAAEASACAGDQHQLAVHGFGARPEDEAQGVAQDVVQDVQQHHLQVHEEDHLGGFPPGV